MQVTTEIRKKLNSPAYFADGRHPKNPCVNCLKFYKEDEMSEIEYVVTSPDGELRWWHRKPRCV